MQCAWLVIELHVYYQNCIMGRGYLHSVLWIVLASMLALIAMYWLPDVAAGDWTMRKIDMLSDLRPDSAATDSVEKLEVKNKIDSCRPGMTCIDDMSGLEHQGMEPLWLALDSLGSLGRPVRIAVLGDSYIEGDILTSDLREALQRRFGGSGVGYLPMCSEVAGFRRSVQQQFGGWTAHNGNDHSGYSPQWANLTGHYFMAGSGAWVSASGVRNFLSRLDTCAQSSFYCMGSGSASVTAEVNGVPQPQLSLSPAGSVATATVRGRIGRVRWTVNRSSGNLAYLGVSMDPDCGIVVDNYSLRSASGFQLYNVSPKMLSDFDAARHYDLVVVMYGLNVATSRGSNYTHYHNKMKEIIDRMKAAMPRTGFLVVGCSDRAERSGGSLKTMRGVLGLINTQQRLAYDCHVAFWNLYEAMGGEGSIVAMVNARPRMANLDYTHINWNGGHHLASIMADAIVWGYQCHQVETGQIKKTEMK